MFGRGAQAVLAIVALVVGVGVAYGVHAVKNPGTTATRPTTTPSASQSALPTPSRAPASPTPIPRVSAAPSAAPSSPVTNPTPTQATSPAGPAAYPPQLLAGTSYSYSGSGTLTAFAADRRDAGSSACAGINESTQTVPAGYVVYFFVSINFPDGNILSAGYIKTGTERHDFGSVQKGSTRNGNANAPGTTTPGSHTYCVTHTASGWSMTDDGTTIYLTTAESAADSSAAEVDFHNSASVNPDQAPAAARAFNLVVPGWHDLTVGGKAPTQLRGVVSRF